MGSCVEFQDYNTVMIGYAKDLANGGIMMEDVDV